MFLIALFYLFVILCVFSFMFALRHWCWLRVPVSSRPQVTQQSRIEAIQNTEKKTTRIQIGAKWSLSSSGKYNYSVSQRSTSHEQAYHTAPIKHLRLTACCLHDAVHLGLYRGWCKPTTPVKNCVSACDVLYAIVLPLFQILFTGCGTHQPSMIWACWWSGHALSSRSWFLSTWTNTTQPTKFLFPEFMTIRVQNLVQVGLPPFCWFL